MACSTGLALPEVLQDGDAKSWFKRFEVCAAANEWNDEKRLKCLPTLLRGRAWAIFDFGEGTFHCGHPKTQPEQFELQGGCLNMLILDDDVPQAVPCSVKDNPQVELDMPQNYPEALQSVLREHAALFRCQLGRTHITKHVIETGEATPVKLSPRPIPFHYTEQVQSQLKDMAKEGIIRPSNSPWCAPAVYVPKNNGEVRICVDFVQLNKATKKDSYPVPRADGPQQKLAHKKIFSKIDLQNAYWQFLMSEESIEKTAFCPGPGYGLWEFTVMPYGLTGAMQTCQRGLDEVLKERKDCVDNYVDDCIIFSDTIDSHIADLHCVLGRLQEAGFTLRGSKCSFSMSSVTHLSFEYFSEGIKPNKERHLQ